MKRSSIGFLLVVIALVAAMIALSVSLRENQKLHSEIAALHDTIVQTESMVNHQRQLLAQARLGSTLLYRMASSKDYDEIFKLIRTIPAESLSCRTMELPEYPSVQLITFHHYRLNADGSILPIDECRSVAIIVKSESLDVVDYVVHQGFSSLEKSSFAPFYIWCGDLPDGTNVRYTILPTGFERNEQSPENNVSGLTHSGSSALREIAEVTSTAKSDLALSELPVRSGFDS